MNIKHLFLTLIICSFFSNAHGMEEDKEDNYSTFHVDGMVPERN